MPFDPVYNPCRACGACCAHFRVSFYWAEADDAGGAVPVDLTARSSGLHTRVMQGTARHPARCVALTGEIGAETGCAIYASRPSPCRDFRPSWLDGVHNPRCDEARAAHGLAPLAPADWEPRPRRVA